ncbi:UNVERIFIED_CONTAM: sigma-B regulation protein RsbU (phosphoserine phosphatase) [Acetivibrio alkalicellulosi]
MTFYLGIKWKILMLVLGISLVALSLSFYISYNGMEKLGNYALDSSDQLGKSAANDSQIALEKQTGEYLLKVAIDQADISDKILSSVKDKVEIMAKYSEFLWDNPQGFNASHPLSPEEAVNMTRVPVFELVDSIDREDLKEELDLLGNMKYVFEPILSGDSNISSIFLGTQSGITIMFSNFPPVKNPGYDPRVRPWYIEASSNKEVIWTETYQDAFGKGYMVTCAKACFDKDGNLKGVLGADVTLKALNDQIISTQIGDLGYAVLIDEMGKVISQPEGNFFDDIFNEENITMTANEEFNKIVDKMISKETGVKKISINNEEKYIAYAPVKSTNWSLAVVMPHDEVVKPIVETKEKIERITLETENYIRTFIANVLKRFVIIFVILFILVIIISISLSNKLTKPIIALNEGVSIVGEGNLDYNFSVNTRDEIEDLANAFNKMTSDLKTYINNLKETTAQKERIESELKIAHSIQNSMLPRIFPPFPERNEIDIYASMEPAKEVGGDFYDFFFIDEKRLCFIMADVSGKGVPAALFMVISKTLLKNQALLGLPPEEILTTVNNMLCEDNDECMFVTAFLAVLEVDTGKMTYSNAGHNPPLLYKEDGGFDWVKSKKGFVLAGMENMKFQGSEITLNKGDKVFLYTDGVTEAMNGEGKLFSDERLKTTLNKLKNLEGKDIIIGVRDDIREHVKEAEQSDDITMMSIKFNG